MIMMIIMIIMVIMIMMSSMINHEHHDLGEGEGASVVQDVGEDELASNGMASAAQADASAKGERGEKPKDDEDTMARMGCVCVCKVLMTKYPLFTEILSKFPI